jgi:hypothetical protein
MLGRFWIFLCTRPEKTFEYLNFNSMGVSIRNRNSTPASVEVLFHAHIINSAYFFFTCVHGPRSTSQHLGMTHEPVSLKIDRRISIQEYWITLRQHWISPYFNKEDK